MNSYEENALREMQDWQRRMQRRPGVMSFVSRGVQNRINGMIPEKVHGIITGAFKVVTRFLLKGSDLLTSQPASGLSLQQRDEEAARKIENYKNAATAEGAITGAGGILLGLADLPLWLSIKIKMLAHLSAIYGHDPGDFRERLYILHILSLTFSGRKHRRKVYTILANWDAYVRNLPETQDAFDWRSFQQEYRDYLDIAKLLQLIPLIGAAVGAVVNHRLTQKLGDAAMNAYRMRWFSQQQALLDAGVKAS